MGPVNSAWTVIFVSCTVNPYDIIVHALGKEKKEKKKPENADTQFKPHLYNKNWT